MTSDDTEHTCLVAEALTLSAGDVALFRDRLAAALRWWLLSLPAGTGLATLRATLRLWAGVPPDRSGVFSAGNGPAMRSALFGVCYGHEPDRLRVLVRASTRLTHTDPKAEWAACAVALAASHSRHGPVLPERYRQDLKTLLGPEPSEFLALIDAAVASVAQGQTPEQSAESIGLGRGVSRYCYHSVPVAVHAWLAHQGDYRSSVLAAVRCGGDSDTLGAITGAIAGARVGPPGLRQHWLSRLLEWPRTVSWMEELAGTLAVAVESGERQHPPALPFAGVLLRNALSAAVVIGHGFRGLLPPF